jgi:Ca-activated chloride channel family protein
MDRIAAGRRSQKPGMSSRLIRLVGVLGCGVIAMAVAAQQQQPAEAAPAQTQPAQPIRVSVHRVSVGVLVSDPYGKFVEGLRREDFHILDNGVEQPITGFLAIAEPAQALMLMESGPAVYLLEGGHLQAARAFLDGLARDDRVAVVKYDNTPQGLVDFTTDKQAVAAAFDELSFNLGFGSLNLSASLSKVLDWLAAINGKKTIVLLSTGVDTSPPKQIEDLLQRLKTGDVRIMAVSLVGNLRNPEAARKKNAPPAKTAISAQQFAEADALLRQIAETSGGQAFFPSRSNELPGVFAHIAQAVRHEFSLAFAPPAQDGAIHSIEVRVTPSASTPVNPAEIHAASTYRVDHRRAYLAPAPN